MSVESSSGVVLTLSDLIGTTEPALKLLLTVLAGYPLAIIHRKYFYGKDPAIQHLFFILSGFSLGYWNYGRDMFHCVFTIFVNYCVLLFIGGTALSVAIVFIFTLSYLLLGYIYTSTANYDINWTMPQCILTLRLIGVAFDMFDGRQPVETLSKDSKKLALHKRPSILEIFGHSLFPASFLVGPQFPMNRYLDFIFSRYSNENKPNQPPESEKEAIMRFSLGILYLIIFQVLGLVVSDDYMLTEDYANTNFFKKMFLLGIWGRYTLYKYISCWLLAEGGCILFGIAYNKDNDEVKWDGVENIKLSIFENTLEFNDYIKSFNVNTNHWIAQYVYKRLKFLGNRNISQIAALGFLAVWHGFHSGYYVCFFFEFVVIYCERDLKSIVKSNEALNQFFSSAQVQLPLHILLRIYTFVLMGWCILPFGLLTFNKYWPAFQNSSYIGIIIFILYPIIYSPILKYIFKKSKSKLETKQN